MPLFPSRLRGSGPDDKVKSIYIFKPANLMLSYVWTMGITTLEEGGGSGASAGSSGNDLESRKGIIVQEQTEPPWSREKQFATCIMSTMQEGTVTEEEELGCTRAKTSRE